MAPKPRPQLERTQVIQAEFDGVTDGIDWGDDDEPLACGVENPDICESCT